MSHTSKVCLVTGASRGIGRGVALQLGSAGARVYVTGKSQVHLQKVAAEIERRGGVCVVSVVDHANDAQTNKLFEKIENEEGKLDLLVNNAYSGVKKLIADLGKPFWDLEPSKWDSEMTVGLRSA